MDKVIFQAWIHERIEGGDVRISGFGPDRDECLFIGSLMQKLGNK